MLPDRVSNPGPLTYESGALPIALRGPAVFFFFFAHLIYMCKSEESFLWSIGNRHKFVSMNITKRQCSSYTHTLKQSQSIIVT